MPFEKCWYVRTTMKSVCPKGAGRIAIDLYGFHCAPHSDSVGVITIRRSKYFHVVTSFCTDPRFIQLIRTYWKLQCRPTLLTGTIVVYTPVVSTRPAEWRSLEKLQTFDNPNGRLQYMGMFQCVIYTVTGACAAYFTVHSFRYDLLRGHPPYTLYPGLTSVVKRKHRGDIQAATPVE